MSADGITVACQGEDLQEVRICLTKDLQPRELRAGCPARLFARCGDHGKGALGLSAGSAPPAWPRPVIVDIVEGGSPDCRYR